MLRFLVAVIGIALFAHEGFAATLTTGAGTIRSRSSIPSPVAASSRYQFSLASRFDFNPGDPQAFLSYIEASTGAKPPPNSDPSLVAIGSSSVIAIHRFTNKTVDQLQVSLLAIYSGSLRSDEFDANASLAFILPEIVDGATVGDGFGPVLQRDFLEYVYMDVLLDPHQQKTLRFAVESESAAAPSVTAPLFKAESNGALWVYLEGVAVIPVAPVPLPAGLPLGLAGFGCLALVRWRLRRVRI